MNPFALTFLLANAAALLLLPRRWAPLPLLMGACYMTRAQEIDIGVFSFTVLRIIVATGIVRAALRGERPAGGLNSVDWLMIAWGGWALLSSAFHSDAPSALVFRLGLVFDVGGVYFLLRAFCQCLEDAAGLFRLTAVLLVPVAAEMLLESVAGRNLFAVFGGVPEQPAVREGRLRAQGPFAHAILAGTVGAVNLPLMIGLWSRGRKTAWIGLGAMLVMIFTCASSGPIMSALAGIFALFMWRYRMKLRTLLRMAVLGYILLDLVMKAPAYYLIARADVVGGSTGWHRARLIESAFEHLSEWWLAGTDYTRHWMPTGVSWSEAHADITNYYLKMGVLGGLPLMLLLIAVMWQAFRLVGRTIREDPSISESDRFLVWTLGASLFAHAATCISVSYFDQSFVFLYLTMAAAGALGSRSAVLAETPEADEEALSASETEVGGFSGTSEQVTSVQSL